MDFKTDEIISTLKQQLESHNANIDVKFTTKDAIGSDTYVVRGQVILLDI